MLSPRLRLALALTLPYQDADCWLAFNVPMGDVTAQAKMAKAAGVKKLVS